MIGKRTEERGAHMRIRVACMPLLLLTLAFVAGGCGDDAVSTSAPTTADMEKDRAALAAAAPNRSRAAKKAATMIEGEGEPDENAYADGGQDYFYDPRNKRDPFRSYRFVHDTGDEKTFGPLGDFELGQLELSAVIWDATNPRALILDPGGRSYIVREGSQIGKNSGQVIHIGDNLVLVKETYENFAGERTTKDVELRIRLSQGG